MRTRWQGWTRSYRFDYAVELLRLGAVLTLKRVARLAGVNMRLASQIVCCETLRLVALLGHGCDAKDKWPSDEPMQCPGAGSLGTTNLQDCPPRIYCSNGAACKSLLMMAAILSIALCASAGPDMEITTKVDPSEKSFG